MIDYLIKLDDSITGRYRTLIRNIKSMSNSYYDSYLDLIETSIKRILDLNNIFYDTLKTCGYLLRDETIEKYFKGIGVEEFTYTKLVDYTKKVNDHKHKKEKTVGIETVINQMRTFHSLMSTYFINVMKSDFPDYDANYYVSIFGITEKENKRLKLESEKLTSELEILSKENKLSKDDNETLQSILSFKNIELLSLDEQNQELQMQISKMKDIKLNSMEEKLNKAIDMLNDMQQYLFESRIVSYKIASVLDGSYRKELVAAQARLEEIKKIKID